MPFCHKCGAQNEPEANYCEECGSPLVTVGQPSSTDAAPPAPPEAAGAQAPPGSIPPAGPPMPLAGPPTPARVPWRLIGVLVLVAAVIGGGIAIYTATSGGDDDGGSLGGREEETMVAPSPKAEETEEQEVTPKPTAARKVTPTPKPKPTVTPAEETVSPPASEGAQVKAIAAFIEGYGEQYAGDCESTNIDTDVGKYCSKLWEDRGDSAIYIIGLTFSEYDTWLLLEKTDGDWEVTDWLGVTEEEPEPPW